jgi:hypothetical protein
LSNVFQLQDTTSSPYTFILPFCDVDNYTIKRKLFNFSYQPQEEAGSAEEQPASNKADTYTIIRAVSNGCFFLIIGKHHGLKKLISNLLLFMLLLLFDTQCRLIILHVTFAIIFEQYE